MANIKLTFSLFTLLSLLLVILFLDTTSARELKHMKNNCLPCTAYGNYYCLESPLLVNLNKDKCYSSSADKEKYCADFDFI